MFDQDQPIQQDLVLPIVVGANLSAELTDRRRATFLQQSILAWMEAQQIADPPWPLVCTDLWYLNDLELRVQPTICIGNPDINAATAALSSKLDSAYLEENHFHIQLDPEFVELKCCIWGVDDSGTRAGLEYFVCNFLPQFLGSIFGIRT
ncbi:MAG: hypothetical protein QGI78_04165 [Phycisphaerales bacterium]|jgi:hypothetical protein|nr:hypothetical protein [Phycisphaerales bacterium]